MRFRWKEQRVKAEFLFVCFFVFPASLRTTLHQIRGEHVTAVSGHSSLCRKQQFALRWSLMRWWWWGQFMCVCMYETINDGTETT